MPQAHVLPYITELEDRGDPDIVAAVKGQVVDLLQDYGAQFRVPKIWGSTPRDQRRAAVMKAGDGQPFRIEPGSRAMVERSEVLDFMVGDRTSAGYSDNRFQLSSFVGVDASDPKDIFVVLFGKQEFLMNEGSIAVAAGWSAGVEAQWQVHVRFRPSGVTLLSVDQRDRPGTPRG